MSQRLEVEGLPIFRELLSSQKEEAYFRFLEKACEQPNTKTICIAVPVQYEDPLSWFSDYSLAYPFKFYWEIPSQSSAIAALGANRRLTFSGSNRFSELDTALKKAYSQIHTCDLSKPGKAMEPRWVGGFSFFDQIRSSFWNGFEPACFTLPKVSLVKERGETTGYISLTIPEDSTVEELHQKVAQRMSLFFSKNQKNSTQNSQNKNEMEFDAEDIHRKSWGFQQWDHAIKEAKKQFHSHKLEKVVLSRINQVSADENYDPVHILSQLRRHYSRGCSFLIEDTNSPAFLGCIPELLLSVRDRTVETEALAGSIARGKDDREDRALADKLFNSSKDQKEHDFVVQSIQENLAPFLKEYNIPEQPVMKKLPNVQHLYMPIKGEMKDDAGTLKILENLHPTPAVGGTPTSGALSFIRNHEPFERGWFAGPVGWITSSGRADFYVALRSGLVQKKQAILFAGCGIVPGSDPQAEWEEADLKFRPMRLALKDE
jgi:menaquinone-specific isochorismate synthase